MLGRFSDLGAEREITGGTLCTSATENIERLEVFEASYTSSSCMPDLMHDARHGS